MWWACQGVPCRRSATIGTASSQAMNSTKVGHNHSTGNHSRAIHSACTSVMPSAKRRQVAAHAGSPRAASSHCTTSASRITA